MKNKLHSSIDSGFSNKIQMAVNYMIQQIITPESRFSLPILHEIYKYHFWMNEELLSMISSNSLQINFFSFKGMLLVNKKQVDVQAKNLFD